MACRSRMLRTVHRVVVSHFSKVILWRSGSIFFPCLFTVSRRLVRHACRLGEEFWIGKLVVHINILKFVKLISIHRNYISWHNSRRWKIHCFPTSIDIIIPYVMNIDSKDGTFARDKSFESEPTLESPKNSVRRNALCNMYCSEIFNHYVKDRTIWCSLSSNIDLEENYKRDYVDPYPERYMLMWLDSYSHMTPR